MLGDLIRKRRKELGLKQSTLAEQVGVVQSLISMIESGAVTDVRMATLRQLSSVLSIPLEELIGTSQLEMPPEVAALQSAGVPDKDLQELAAKWAGLSAEDRQLALVMVRSMWERRHADAAGRSRPKAGNPSQPTTE